MILTNTNGFCMEFEYLIETAIKFTCDEKEEILKLLGQSSYKYRQREIDSLLEDKKRLIELFDILFDITTAKHKEFPIEYQDLENT